METAAAIMQNCLSYYIVRVLGILCLLAICLLYVIKSNKSSCRIAFAAIALVIWLIVYITSSIAPFLQDYSIGNIKTITGTYVRLDESKGKSSSSGLHTVAIISGDESILLTTAPWNSGDFPVGEFPVIAYYTPNSHILLHIERVDAE